MKQLVKPRWVIPGMWVLGLLTLLARRGLYAAPVDMTGLLNRGNPLNLAALLCLAALALAMAACCQQPNSGEYPHGRGLVRFGGYTALAAGILITVLLNAPLLPGGIGALWKLLGYGSPVCLFLAGYARLQGKDSSFLLHGIPCAFLAVHLVDHYQLWCSNPQIQDYLFTLLATVCLAFFSYQLAAFDVDRGSRRTLVFWGLLAQFLCLAELAQSQNLYLYAGGLLWTASMLWEGRAEKGGVGL